MSVAPSSGNLPSLEKYELVEEIGHGGMATVYRAQDPRLQRSVAVKIIHKHLRDNAEVNRRFTAEARAVAKLRHPNIVEVYDVSEDDDIERYLVVELIEGMSLRQALSQAEVLPAEIAAIVTAALCRAAHHAHECDVVHRDIKPENVLIALPEDEQADDERPSRPSRGSLSTPGLSRIKLTDFGIAKLLDAQGVTSTGQILGSPAHMAPEQIEGGHVGPQTDVFALGVLMYECMVGSLPFEGKNPAQVLRRVLDGDYEQADSLRPKVGRRWASMVARALDKDYTQRFQSAAEFADEIETELAELGIEDLALEADAYFSDPEGYRSDHDERLVAVLLERGQEGQRAGDVQGAAADLNRALAFRPNDLQIIKRISSLSRTETIKRFAVRLVALCVLAGLVGATAFAVARALRSRDDALVATRLLGESLRTLPLPETPSVVPTSKPTATASGARPANTVAKAPSAVPTFIGTAAKRAVRFRVNPGGARLTLDGKSVDWSAPFELRPGPHSVVARMPAGNPCCEATSRSINVQPVRPGEGNRPQTFVVNLTFRPARARLINAPSGGSVSCGNGLTVVAGAVGQVRMNSVAWSGRCRQSPGGNDVSVTLRAGQVSSILWR